MLPAVARKELFEQANKLAFVEGALVAYNDEVSIFEALPEVEGIDGAIDGKKLYDLLSRLTSETVELTASEEKLTVKSGRTKASFDLSPVVLPIDEIDRSGGAAKLPDGFKDALKLVSGTCARDMSKPALTCVHMQAGLLEASDGFRLARLKFGKKVSLPPAMLPVNAAQIITDYPIDDIAIGLGGEWIRFTANDSRTTLYARLSAEKFPDLDSLYEFEGDEVEFPQNLAAVLDRARIFAKREHSIDEEVKIDLKANQVVVSATCSGSEFSEVVRWNKDVIGTFAIHPDFLAAALQAGSNCVVGKEKIKFVGENWEHVIALR